MYKMEQLKKLLIFLVSFCQAMLLSQDSGAQNLASFNSDLGANRAALLDQTIVSFDAFLETNFGEERKTNDRIKAYLRSEMLLNNANPEWKIDRALVEELLLNWELSGLRREIYLRSDEAYSSSQHLSDFLPKVEQSHEPMKIISVHFDSLHDSLLFQEFSAIAYGDLPDYKERVYLRPNVCGKFFIALAKNALPNIEIQEYLETSLSENFISRGVFAGGLLEHISNFNNPFWKRIIVAEFYFFTLMRMSDN